MHAGPGTKTASAEGGDNNFDEQHIHVINIVQKVESKVVRICKGILSFSGGTPLYHLVLVSNQLLSPRNYNAGIFPLELWKWADRGIREGGNCITMKKVVSRAEEQRRGKRRRVPSPPHSSSRLTINQPKGAITASAVNEMARGKRHLASPCRATGLPVFPSQCRI